MDRNFRTINQISDKRLKLGYRLMLISGLRVSEVADLEPGDIRIRDDGVIDLHIRNGKGGKTGNVECMKDDYVRKHLRELLDIIEPGQKVFYSASTMEKQATNLGMECHDLRRIYSKHRLRELIEEEAMSKGKAHQIVQKELRHESGKTTDLYLYGRKFVLYSKRGEEMNCVLKYPGAKNRIAPWICEYIPAHDVYLEPYFGSGAVFFHKVPARIETINDLDGDVVNFFQVIREEAD